MSPEQKPQEGIPPVVLSLERWALWFGVAVFCVALVTNLFLHSPGQWMPMALVAVVMGPVSYYILRAVVRFHFIFQNPYMTSKRVRAFLGFALAVCALFCGALLLGLVFWPRT